MKSIYKDAQPAPTIPKLAMSPKEAARALSLCEKSLWNVTSPRGPVPCVRIGSRVLYPTHLLRKWMNREAVRQQREAERQPEKEAANES